MVRVSLVGKVVFSLEYMETKKAAVHSSKFLMFQTFNRNLQKAIGNESIVQKRFGIYQKRGGD